MMLLAVMMLTMTAQTAWAGDTPWPDYVTDIILIGGNQNEVNNLETYYENQGYKFAEYEPADLTPYQSLNYSTGGDIIYIGYKRDYRPSTNGGYITDLIVVDVGNNTPSTTFSHNNRTYYLAPYDGSDRFESVKGNLNSGAGGNNIYLYYTKDNFDDKRAVHRLYVHSDNGDDAVKGYNSDGTAISTQGINMNYGISGSAVHCHIVTLTKTNRPATEPVWASGLVYNGSAQKLVATPGTSDSGTIKYGKYTPTGLSYDTTTDPDALTKTTSGTIQAYYYVQANEYGDASRTKTQDVTIAKSPNDNCVTSVHRYSAYPVEMRASLSVSGTNLSTGSITYLYSTAADGHYSETSPSEYGTYWVKAYINSDENCEQFTTAPVQFSLVKPFGGSGLGNNPYIITTSDQLLLMAYRMQYYDSYRDGYYRLDADLNFDGTTNNMIPIGTNTDTAFRSGTFDGNGHTISGVNISLSGTDNVGLFGCSGAIIKNLKIANSTFIGRNNVGAIVGRNYPIYDYPAKIQNCVVASDVTVSGTENVGGIIGLNSNHVTGINNCVNLGHSVTGTSHVGAISGIGGNFSANYYTDGSLPGGVNGADADGARKTVTIGRATGVTITPTGTATTYNGITTYSNNLGFTDNGTYYAGATEVVKLDISYSGNTPEGFAIDGYTDGLGNTLESNSDGTFTLTVPSVTSVTLTPDDVNGLCVNMPKQNSKTVTIPSTATIFKVYDDGGKTGNYSNNCNGTLVLKAPTGYKIQLSGSITMEKDDDKLTVYNGDHADDENKLIDGVGSTSNGTKTDIAIVYSTDNEMTICFSSDGGYNYAGLDLTVTVFDPTASFAISVDNATGGTVTSSPTSAIPGSTVNLTAHPANGYILSDLKVMSGKIPIPVTWTQFENNASFTMPGGNVTVIPTFITPTITVNDAQTGGTVTPSATSALPGSMVTLTIAPTDGYVLSDLSVKDDSNNDVAVTGATWYNNQATFVMPVAAVTVTPTFTDNLTANISSAYINIPNSGDKPITIPSGVTSFKVYDDGGKDGAYSSSCSGTLTLTAPTCYRIQLSGSIKTETDYDKLTVWDGTDTSKDEKKLIDGASSPSNGTKNDITIVYSTDNEMTICFSSNDANNYDGLDLTVAVFKANEVFPVAIVNPQTGGTVTSDKLLATRDETVTLTAHPDNGYVLTGISVKDDGNNDIAVTDDTWYNYQATFTMPSATVTVTPAFSTQITAEDGLYVNMPATGNKAVSIPASVVSFKVYDDGGKDGNFSEYCNGTITLTAPKGYKLRLTGSLTTAWHEHRLNVFDGVGTDNDYLLKEYYSDNCYEDGWGVDHYGSQDLPDNIISSDRYMTIQFYQSYNQWCTTVEGLDLTVTLVNDLELADDADNTTVIANNDKLRANVTLSGRTFYKDGGWNTLTLPFALTAEQIAASPLAGAIIKEMLTTSNLTDGKMTLNVDDATAIVAGKPYIVKWVETPDLTISTAAEWNAFATAVNGGTSYEGKLVKLTADINGITTMAGSSESNSFMGTFDGAGHTLTVNYSPGENICAPFRYVKNATIKNLVVDGTVNNSGKQNGGVAGYSYGTTTISSCLVTTGITCSFNGDSSNGGFVAHMENGTLAFTNCKFGGKLLGSSSHSSGGFLGWRSNGSVSFTSCLYDPTERTMETSGSATFNRNEGSTFDKCYYKETYNTAQGIDASTMNNNELLKGLGSGWEIKNEKVVPKIIFDIVNPKFTGVTIDATAPSGVTSSDGNVTLTGTYAPFAATDGLLFDAHNTANGAFHAALSATTRDHYAFGGWYTDAGLTTAATSIPFAADGSATLYTKWIYNLSETDGITDAINDELKGKTVNIAFSRTFEALSSGEGKASTLCLPFDLDKSSTTTVGTFYTFGGVSEISGEYVVKMNEVPDATTTLTAGTPYMFKPATTDPISFQNTAYTVPSTGFTPAGTTTDANGWEFRGTYKEITWPDGQTRLYAFAASNFEKSDGSLLNDVGAFRRYDWGHANPFRCYLWAPDPSTARGVNGAPGSLPQSMKVVLVSANGETTGIGTLDNRTGEVTFGDEWYSLDGQKLDGKPKKKGLYINKGNKVIIK